MSKEIERLSTIKLSSIGKAITDYPNKRQFGRHGHLDYPMNIGNDCISCTKYATGIIPNHLQCQLICNTNDINTDIRRHTNTPKKNNWT